ncbi:hypothetical protein [Thermovibrio sp.]
MLRFNFAEIRESAFEKYVKPDIIFLILVVVAAIGLELFFENSVKAEIELTKREIARLEAEKKRLRRVQREEKKLITKKKELEEKLRIVSNLDKNRKVPKPLYFFASNENMKDIWLNQLKLSGKKVHVNGNIWRVEEFPLFLKRVEENIGDILFRQTRRIDYENKNLNFKVHFYNFEFEAEQK